MRLLTIWLTSAAISMLGDDRAVVYGQADPSPSRSHASATAPATDRLHVAVLFLTDDLGKAIAREDARVERLCTNASNVAACTTRERRPLTLHFVRVRTAPSITAPIAGDLLVIGRWSEREWHFAFVYRASTDGPWRTWIRDVGDWGYGLHLSGVRSRDGWIGLSGAPFDGDVWIYGGGEKDRRGEATSIAGQILELHDVRARRGNGRTRVLPSGSYFITGIDRAGVVTFREELDIDMPCGEDVIPPTVMPPMFRAPASAFFDAPGRPRFAVKYTKGC